MEENINYVSTVGDASMSYIGPSVSSDMSEEINEIAAALSKAQSEFETAKKGEEGYGYSYSDLATVIAAAKPILAKHGLAVVQLPGSTDNSVRVTTILTHSSGQFFRSVASLPVINMKSCNAAQNAGASLSYLRRYAYQAIIGQASEDNDASDQGFKKPKSTTSYSKKKETKVEVAAEEEKPTKRQRFRKPKKENDNGSDGLDL